MRCLNCQRVIPASVKFCAYCGTEASAPASAPSAPAPPPPTAPPPNAPPPAQPNGIVGRIRSYIAAHKVIAMGATSLAAVIFVFVVALLSSLPDPPPPPEAPTPTATLTSTPTSAPAPTPIALLPCAAMSVADVMENALPSVVQVLTDDGSGSGFIVNEDGLVVTNEHVIEGYEVVEIRLGTGRVTYLGEVIETHSTLDLAYIQIDSSRPFTPIVVGDSDKVRAVSYTHLTLPTKRIV